MSPRFVTPPLLAACWYAGQSWRVEYLRTVPSPAKQPSPPPRPPQRSVWQYRVANADPERRVVQIEASEEGGEGNLELFFDLPRLTLRRVVKIAGNRRIDLIRHAGS